jgi:hypothetical protein
MLVFAIAMLAGSPARADASAARRSKAPIKASNAWKRYVIDPGKLVYPKAVYVVGESPGNVRNTRGLRAPGGATTIAETGLNEHGVGSPSLILDLGVNVGDYVEIGITASDGTPATRARNSEACQARGRGGPHQARGRPAHLGGYINGGHKHRRRIYSTGCGLGGKIFGIRASWRSEPRGFSFRRNIAFRAS